MKRKLKRQKACTTFLAMSIALATSSPVAAQEEAFTPLLEQNSLNGWTGDADFFSVENGILKAGSPDPVPRNTFLIHDQPYADFELRYRYRWATPAGNSGIQFRSGVAEGHFALAGMQANLTPVVPQGGSTPTIGRIERFGMLYDELGDKAEMVLLGQKATITRRAAGSGGRGRVVRTVESTTNSREAIVGSVKPYPEWNEVVLIAHGPRIIHVINGLVAFDATDNDPLSRKDGLIGIQVHSGPEMIVELKDMEIRRINALPDLRGYSTNPQPAPEPRITYKDSTVVGMEDVALPTE